MPAGDTWESLQGPSMTLAQLWVRTLQHRRATRRLRRTGRSSCARCASCMISSAPSSEYPWSLGESLTSICFTSRFGPTCYNASVLMESLQILVLLHIRLQLACNTVVCASLELMGMLHQLGCKHVGRTPAHGRDVPAPLLCRQVTASWNSQLIM